MSADNGDNGPGRREVAHRLFAAEFDDASLSYSESDEERAPNYVVTPTGARVNRLFAVGVLTEKEPVNDDVLRGRLADPTGAFVSYAGQYQPDEMAFLDRTTPPAFLALTGKARTFEPEDSDRVFTSVRPESLNDVDGDTRDRWVVTTARATLERIAVFDAALDSENRGDALARELEARGVTPSLASGIPLAIDHYGTSRAYLDAVRQLAVDALEVVTGDREEVRSLDLAPGEGGDVALGPLPAVELGDAPDIETPAEVSESAVEPDEPEPDDSAAAETDAAASTETLVDEAASEEAGETAAEPAEAVSATDTGTEPTSDPSEPDPLEGTDAEPVAETPAETPAESAAAETDAAGSTETLVDDAATESDDVAAEPAEATGTADSGLGNFDDSDGADTSTDSGLSDFDDDLGDFDDSADTESGLGDFDDEDETTEPAESATETAETDDSGMYELPEEERKEVEAEFGTEFSTGSEVGDPGEADIDVPDADDLESELDAADSETEETEEAEPAATAPSADADADADSGSADDTAADAADVDLEDAAVAAMSDLDDGDGASREAVVAAVVDEYGVDPSAVEDAIQDALMNGQCYEPNEDQLKAI